MTDFPDQKPLWDAYGHALGAIGGVELLLRLALMNSAVARMVADGNLSEERKKKELERIQRRTLGCTVAVFKGEFPEFGDDERFCESIENAVYCRNQLAHHFVENHLLAFRSHEGVELTILECMEHVDHFRGLEAYLRDRCPVDYDAFFKLGEGREDDFVENHPLREKLRAIKEGRLRPAQQGSLS